MKTYRLFFVTGFALILPSLLCLNDAKAESVHEKAIALYQQSELLEKVDLKKYNCLADRVAENGGKCDLSFLVEGQAIPLELKASPEVAALWAVRTKYAPGVPMKNLRIRVLNKSEVLEIRDSAGEIISKKINFTDQI